MLTEEEKAAIGGIAREAVEKPLWGEETEIKGRIVEKEPFSSRFFRLRYGQKPLR